MTALSRRGPRIESLEEPALRRAAENRAAASPRLPDAAELLDRLPAQYRQAMALFYMQEKSYDEVAEMLGIPVGTVRTHLFCARKMLAEEMVRRRVWKGGA